MEDKAWGCPLGQEDHVSSTGGLGIAKCPDKDAYLAKVRAQREKREEARRLEAKAREAERIMLEGGNADEPQCTNPEDEACAGTADDDVDGANACSEWAARGDCE